jgi:hypothetical protein
LFETKHFTAGSTGLDRSSELILTEVVVEANSPVADSETATHSIGEIRNTVIGGEDSKVPSGEPDRGGVVRIHRVNAKLALSLRAVSALVAMVALASHRGIRVSELVHVVVVGIGQLSLRLAHTVARAAVGETRQEAR